jgi:protein disulfide-isomerase-like protein
LKKAGAANGRVHDDAVSKPVREALSKVMKRVIVEKTKDAGQIKNALADAFAPLSSVFTYWLTGKHSYLKSDKVPATQGAVTVVVGKTFKKLVTERKGDVLLEFYAHWCQHCQELEPKWNELGRLFKGTPVTIAKIESTRNDFPANYSVNGYPTIFFAPLDADPILYEGEREVADFVNFIEQHRTDKSFKMPDVPVVKSDVVVLTDDNFADTASGSWFVKFYAPWCGHCKSLAPTWSELATASSPSRAASRSPRSTAPAPARSRATSAQNPGLPDAQGVCQRQADRVSGPRALARGVQHGFLAQHSEGAAAHDEL